MKPIVGLHFSSSALKSCQPPPPLYSQVSLNRWWEEEPQQGSSVSGLLAELQGCWLMLGSRMASLLCFFFLFLSCCFVLFFAHPGPSSSAFGILHAVFSTLSRLRMTWEQHRRLLGTEPFALTDWLTEEFSVLCCFSFTLCNSLDVFFFSCVISMEDSCHVYVLWWWWWWWCGFPVIEFSAVQFDLDSDQTWAQVTPKNIQKRLKTWCCSTVYNCMCEAPAVFVCSDAGSILFFTFLLFFLVRWSTEDGGDVLCHYMSRDCRGLMPNWCCDLRFCWQDAEFRMEEDSRHYVCVSIFLQPDTKNLSGPFVQQVCSLVTVPPELLCLKCVCVRCMCRKTLKKKKK